MNRRGVLLGMIGAGSVGALGAASYLMLTASPAKASDIVIHKTPTCGCCTAWVDHLKEHGFEVEVHDYSQGALNHLKRQLGVPERLESCHTGVVGGYLIEGHVPADDIYRLIAERPDLQGISVPRMPIGTPGMEMGDQKDPFDVIGFGEGEDVVFSSYR